MSEQNVVHVARDEYLDSIKALADDGYTMCVDLTGVDYLELAGRTVPDGVVEAGRPACQWCAFPIDPDGHDCPRMN